MKKNNILMLGAAAMTAAAIASCSGNKGWGVEGTIAGASDTTVYVEASTFNNWRAVDTLEIGSDGTFSYSSPEAAAVPTVYRLRYGDRYIYFPVDSLETVMVEADAKHFDRGYKLSGNNAAAAFVTVDSLIAAAVDGKGTAAAVADPALKRTLSLMVNQDTTCIVSYYIIGKTVGSTPLYNLKDKMDVRVLGNVANNFRRFRPNDPRAAELEQRWLNARRDMGYRGSTVTMEASEKSRPDVPFKRYDRSGKEYDLDKVVTRGGVTVLNFICYAGEGSQANTVALNDVYSKYKDSGLQIFQVSFDPDEMTWKRSAANMPWIAVWNAPTDPVDILVAYNADPVNGGPVSFIFNRQGELVDRVTDPSKLAAAVAKVM